MHHYPAFHSLHSSPSLTTIDAHNSSTSRSWLLCSSSIDIQNLDSFQPLGYTSPRLPPWFLACHDKNHADRHFLCELNHFFLSFFLSSFLPFPPTTCGRIMTLPNARIRRRSSLEKRDPFASPEVYYAKEDGLSSLVQNRLWVTRKPSQNDVVNRRRSSHGKWDAQKNTFHIMR